jgi:hypothetical protein
MSDARTVDFFRLPQDTRERFVGCVTARAAPAPLLQTVPALGTMIFWRVVLCGLVVAGLAWLGYNGFGEVDDRWMVQSPWVLLLYAGLLALGALAILGAFRAIALRRQLPFPPGKYLFPLDLVDAQTRELRILPLAALESTRMVEHQNEGAYTHTAFEFHYQGGEHHTFNVNNQVTAAMVASAIDASRAAIRTAVDAQDLQAIAGMDVFIEPRLTGTWQVEPRVGEFHPGLPIFLARWRLAALVAGFVVAVPLWHLRNVRSDDLGFRHAIAWANDGGPGFEVYLVRGRRHADRVRQTFLPRAAIRKAQKAGALAELESLVERHRGTPLEVEAREAREQVLGEIATRADRANDLRALREFLRAHPGSRLESHVRGAIARIYRLAMVRYRLLATGDVETAAFVMRLLDHLGAGDSPDVPVRFDRRPTGTVMGRDDVAWIAEEEMFVRQLNLELATLWAKDADQFVAFRREGSAAQSSPQPAMTVTYGVTPRGRGAQYAFAVSWDLPDAGAPKLSTKLARPARGHDDSPRQAFHDLKIRLRLLLFRERPPGWLTAPAIAADPDALRLPTPVRVPSLPRTFWELPRIPSGR